MKQVFYNCILYNGSQSEIGKIGISVQNEFERLSKEHNLESFLINDAKSEVKSEVKTEAQSNYEGSHYRNTTEEYKEFDEHEMKEEDLHSIKHEDHGFDFQGYDHHENDAVNFSNDNIVNGE